MLQHSFAESRRIKVYFPVGLESIEQMPQLRQREGDPYAPSLLSICASANKNTGERINQIGGCVRVRAVLSR